MADKQEYRKELESPDGRRVVSTSARDTNDLIFGGGYREVQSDADAAPDGQAAAPEGTP